MMKRTFHITSKDEYRPGQVVTVSDTMPDSKPSERYKIVKLLKYVRSDELGEFEVEPVDVSKDPGNMRGKDGHVRSDIR